MEKNSSKIVTINGRPIGQQHSPYVVAELSANHNGSLQRALDTISAAKAAGADAIKLQTYTADTITIDCDRDEFIIHGGLWDGYKLYDLYKEAQTPFEWHKDLFDHARKEAITCFSTPFDETAVDLLENLNAPAYKIASFEAIDIPLIKYVAQTKKPMVISTGLANLQEIEEAVDTALTYGNGELILLHCISSYPAPMEQSNLRTIPDLASRFPIVPGLSDHTMGVTASIAAVALGASFIEKHFILNRADGGPDSSFSLEPHDLKLLCQSVKDAWSALGQINYERKESEQGNAAFRRSLYFVQDVKKGQPVSKANVRSIRPGYGIATKNFDQINGKPVTRDIVKGEPVSWTDFE